MSPSPLDSGYVATLRLLSSADVSFFAFTFERLFFAPLGLGFLTEGVGETARLCAEGVGASFTCSRRARGVDGADGVDLTDESCSLAPRFTCCTGVVGLASVDRLGGDGIREDPFRRFVDGLLLADRVRLELLESCDECNGGSDAPETSI